MTDAAIEQAAKRLGLHLERPELLRQALAVAAPARGGDDPLVRAKERLEYLGDAVLGFAAADYLFGALPEASEGVLSALRAGSVSEAALARIAEQAGVAEALGHVPAPGARGRDRLLASTLEAIVGALYTDAGLEAARAWIMPRLTEKVEELLAGDYLPPKSRLQEQTQSGGGGTPVYRVVSAVGAEHERTFEVEVLVDGKALGRGKGPSRRAAEQAAAADALARM